VLLGALVSVMGCGSNRFRGPTFLAAVGAAAAGGGATIMAVGSREQLSELDRAGAISLAAGVGMIIAAGYWISVKNRCETDSDCDEKESCQHLVTPAGQISQCVGR
jgi:hypothetical protein